MQNRELQVQTELKNYLFNKPKKRKMPNGDIIYSNEPYADELYKFYLGQTVEFTPLNVGNTIQGRIAQIMQYSLLIETDGKITATLKKDPKELPYIKDKVVGDYINVLVTKSKNDEVLVSAYEYDQLFYKKDLDESLRNETPILAKVVKYNNYGYILDYNGIKLFMSIFNADINKLPDVTMLLDLNVYVIVEDYSTESGMYMVSRKKYLESNVAKEVAKLVQDNVYDGFVTGTTPYGIFVQFHDCLTGLIHKDNVLPEYKDSIQDIKPGTPIQFYYREIGKGGKIILSQVNNESIWDNIGIDDIYEGIIEQKITSGYLIRLDWETVGVLPKTELEKSKKQYKEGDKISVRVTTLIKGERKIYFNLA